MGGLHNKQGLRADGLIDTGLESVRATRLYDRPPEVNSGSNRSSLLGYTNSVDTSTDERLPATTTMPLSVT